MLEVMLLYSSMVNQHPGIAAQKQLNPQGNKSYNETIRKLGDAIVAVVQKKGFRFSNRIFYSVKLLTDKSNN